jgi:hypothetical protein
MKPLTMTVGATMRSSQNYQSAEGNVSITVELEPGEDPRQCWRKLQTMVSTLARKGADETLAAHLMGDTKG